jgi:hypothetical protein
VIKHPDLVRKLILTGTGPAGGKDIDKVAGITYRDILRAALTRSDAKEWEDPGSCHDVRRREGHLALPARLQT